MSTTKLVRVLTADELPTAFALVQQVFDRFEAPDYGEEGVESFRQFLDLKERGRDLQAGKFFVWGAFDGDRLVGVSAMREDHHISLLFVQEDCQRQGVGTQLLHTMCSHAVASGAEALTVNSSPYGVAAYQRWGFVPKSGEQTVDGIRFTPMSLTL